MLVLLCGSSGVGRSECLKRLVADHGWVTVPWLTTRAPRDGERDRISVSQGEFEDADRAGSIFYRFEFHGHHYAILRRHVRAAVESPLPHGTDVLPSSLAAFDAVARVAIGITADAFDLGARLDAAGRGQRRLTAELESRLLFEPAVADRVDRVLVSHEGKLAELAGELAALPLPSLVRRPRA
ncbi:hypothetical protein SAMN05421812_104237 [Asanoa hainanensis]|uniref:Guanylate kinase/L-type calcium channel beta subunit domain-containing protein n=2 Tax=Asanoa hainanensis TaxID=560556 RepID=A0A239LCT3_9ACTN|nr:hypothetical protein SAMN05421812_104237 [Asanoa hainanensis]